MNPSRTENIVRFIFIFLGAGMCLAMAASGNVNFGGEWKLNQSKSDPGSRPFPQTRVEQIVQNGASIEVVITDTDATGASLKTTWKYRSDGTPTENKQGGLSLTTTGTWNGDVLVLEDVGTLKSAGELHIQQRWSLSADGKILTVKRHIKVQTGEFDQTLTFDKI